MCDTKKVFKSPLFCDPSSLYFSKTNLNEKKKMRKMKITITFRRFFCYFSCELIDHMQYTISQGQLTSSKYIFLLHLYRISLIFITVKFLFLIKSTNSNFFFLSPIKPLKVTHEKNNKNNDVISRRI